MVDIGSIGFDMSDSLTETPMSRTHQYRKVMKPMLERKRRARINKCLDELKDLMVHALQHEGESITKLEKADVLELTVRHLRKLKRQQMLALNPGLDLDRFHAGYTACATEVNRCLTSMSGGGVDLTVSTRLLTHLGQKLSSQQQQQQREAPQLLTPLSQQQPQLHKPLSQQQQLHTPLSIEAPHHHNHQKHAHSPPSDQGYMSGRDSTPSPREFVKREHDSVWRPF